MPPEFKNIGTSLSYHFGRSLVLGKSNCFKSLSHFASEACSRFLENLFDR